MENDTPSRDEETFQPPDEAGQEGTARTQALRDELRANRTAPHILALLRQGLPLSTASLARAAAVTVDSHALRLDGIVEATKLLEVSVKILDSLVLEVAFELHTLMVARASQRGEPRLPSFFCWLRGLVGRLHTGARTATEALNAIDDVPRGTLPEAPETRR